VTTVSVIGLGLMGRPMARRLLDAGFAVRGWNRSPLDPALVEGLPRAATLAEAATSQVCLLMLTDAAAVDAVLAGLEPHLGAGAVVLDMSSAEPERSRDHAARLAGRGVGWVDAPVSGGPEGAGAGTLAIMAGGSDADFATVRPLLEVLGGNVVHVGGPGMGHTVKLVNQLIVALAIQAVAEGLTLAERAGVDPQLAQQAMRGGFADSKVLQIHGARMIKRDYTPGGYARLHLKDLRMAERLAASVGAELPHFADVMARYQRLVDAGQGDLDHSALHKLLWE
jgi:2-hydroxy-3-oxopropionate reductase